MTDDQEFLVLQAFHDNKDKFPSEQELYAFLDKQIGWKDFLNIISHFEKRGYVEDDQVFHRPHISAVGQTRYSSLLSLRKSYHKDQQLKTTDTTLTIFSKISAIIFGITTFIFAYLSYQDRHEINELKRSNSDNKKAMQLLTRDKQDLYEEISHKQWLLDSLESHKIDDSTRVRKTERHNR